MSVKNMETINVLNYNESVVAIATRDNEYIFNPSEDGSPTIVPLSFKELEYVNSNSHAIKSGLLRFPEDIEEELYNELRITDWENILKNSDIEEIITHPTMEGLQKLIDIKSSTIFERVRGVFTKLKNSGNDNVSIRVEKIINTRYKELVNRQSKSDIILTAKDSAVNNAANEDVASLKEQLANMQEMMAKMIENQSIPQSNDAKEIVEIIDDSQDNALKKSVGRPSKNK